MAAEPIIRIEGISRRFGTVGALSEVSFDIAEGAFFSLLGPSGCGKTTLLRILAGIDQPSSGRLMIGGQDMTLVPAHLRPTNMVFQNYAIFPHLNVAENVGYGLRNMPLSRAEAEARVAEILTLVKLGGMGERNAHQLSGGQRQRVALARALVCRPRVLLLDEPLSALDKNLREEMQLELRALQRTVGITFVFVTHDQEEAMTLSDQIAVMEAGRVLQIDSPRGLYERPASRQVAAFIGTMNFFPVRLDRVGDGMAKVTSSLFGQADAPVAGAAPAPGAAVFLALRPEELTLQAPPASGGLAGTITSVAYLGGRLNCQVTVPGHAGPVAVQCPAPPGRDLTQGTAVSLSWGRDAGLVLAG